MAGMWRLTVVNSRGIEVCGYEVNHRLRIGVLDMGRRESMQGLHSVSGPHVQAVVADCDAQNRHKLMVQSCPGTIHTAHMRKKGSSPGQCILGGRSRSASWRNFRQGIATGGLYQSDRNHRSLTRAAQKRSHDRKGVITLWLRQATSQLRTILKGRTIGEARHGSNVTALPDKQFPLPFERTVVKGCTATLYIDGCRSKVPERSAVSV